MADNSPTFQQSLRDCQRPNSRGIGLFRLFLSVFGILAFTHVSAQSTSTNAVLTVTLNLTGYIQQPTNENLPSVTVRKFTTKDVIASIESDLGLPTNDLATAKLLLKFRDLGGSNAPALGYVLRTSAGDTNVDGFFGIASGSVEQLGNLTVSTSRPVPNGVSTRTDFTLGSVSVTTTNLTFQAQGLVKFASSSVRVGKTIVESRPIPTSYSAAVTGSGHVGTNSTVFSGAFTAGNRKVE